MSDSSIPKIVAIAVSNLRRLVAQPLMLFTTLLLPFLVTAIVGIALGGSQSRLEAGIVSHSDDDLARQLVSGLGASSALEITTFSAEADLDKAIRRGQVSAGIVVPAGYGQALAKGTSTAVRFVTTPNQTRSAAIRAVVLSTVDQQTRALQAARFSNRFTGRTIPAETRRAEQLEKDVAQPRVVSESVVKPSITSLGFAYTAPSNLVLFIVITSLTSAAALIDTRTRGITARMFAMPLRRSTVLLGELLGRFVVALGQAAVILLSSALVLGVSWGDPLAVGVLTLVLCAFGAALGMAVGFGARTMSQAVSFGPPFGVVLGMLGGCMWPLVIVGSTVSAIGHVTPHAWAMDGYIKLVNEGAGLGEVLPQVMAVTGFAVATLALAGLVVSRSELR